MNLFSIFDEITSVDGVAIRNIASMGTKVAAAAMPFMLGSLFKKAYGQVPTDATGVLNYALTLEYLEAEFYTLGIAASGLVPSGPPTGAITTIRDHEIAHVAV